MASWRLIHLAQPLRTRERPFETQRIGSDQQGPRDRATQKPERCHHCAPSANACSVLCRSFCRAPATIGGPATPTPARNKQKKRGGLHNATVILSPRRPKHPSSLIADHQKPLAWSGQGKYRGDLVYWSARFFTSGKTAQDLQGRGCNYANISRPGARQIRMPWHQMGRAEPTSLASLHRLGLQLHQCSCSLATNGMNSCTT